MSASSAVCKKATANALGYHAEENAKLGCAASGEWEWKKVAEPDASVVHGSSPLRNICVSDTCKLPTGGVNFTELAGMAKGRSENSGVQNGDSVSASGYYVCYDGDAARKIDDSMANYINPEAYFKCSSHGVVATISDPLCLSNGEEEEFDFWNYMWVGFMVAGGAWFLYYFWKWLKNNADENGWCETCGIIVCCPCLFIYIILKGCFCPNREWTACRNCFRRRDEDEIDFEAPDNRDAMVMVAVGGNDVAVDIALGTNVRDAMEVKPAVNRSKLIANEHLRDQSEKIDQMFMMFSGRKTRLQCFQLLSRNQWDIQRAMNSAFDSTPYLSDTHYFQRLRSRTDQEWKGVGVALTPHANYLRYCIKEAQITDNFQESMLLKFLGCPGVVLSVTHPDNVVVRFLMTQNSEQRSTILNPDSYSSPRSPGAPRRGTVEPTAPPLVDETTLTTADGGGSEMPPPAYSLTDPSVGSINLDEAVHVPLKALYDATKAPPPVPAVATTAQEEKLDPYEYSGNAQGNSSLSAVMGLPKLLPRNRDQITDLFRNYDRSHSGYLEMNEMERLLLDIGVKPKDLKSLISNFRNTFDRDGNGKFDLSEFYDWYKSLETKNPLLKRPRSRSAGELMQTNKTSALRRNSMDNENCIEVERDIRLKRGEDGKLGIEYDHVLKITKCTPNAYSCGLEAGDKMCAIDGVKVSNIPAFRDLTENKDAFTVRIKRMTPEEDALPEEFFCPITQEIMSDPVTIADGTTYERKAISDWLSAHQTSPISNIRLPHKRLTVNVVLMARICAYKAGPS